MIELIWPDGKLTSGKTFEEVEEALRAEQWHSYETQEAFREDMRKRAYAWCGHEPTHGHTAQEFIEALAGCDLFVMLERTTK